MWFSIDAGAYLAALPGLKGVLPGGAWEFVSDAGHYSFSSDRCVKDLELAEVSLLDEVRPAPGGGIVHEIELTDATIVVRCADLVAVWQKG
ncbi:hypothetical protein AB0H77_01855 [Streptomyces sp. NPDC050844]|uniref:hypothetical protein n=1 Tax=Streptomyces sp. NPDC050844 TaxID=3155790 RepID=UPI0033F3A57C